MDTREKNCTSYFSQDIKDEIPLTFLIGVNNFLRMFNFLSIGFEFNDCLRIVCWWSRVGAGWDGNFWNEGRLLRLCSGLYSDAIKCEHDLWWLKSNLKKTFQNIESCEYLSWLTLLRYHNSMFEQNYQCRKFLGILSWRCQQVLANFEAKIT